MPPLSSSFSNSRLSSPRALRWIRPVLFIAALALVYFLGTSAFSAARMKLLIDPALKALFHPNSQTQLFVYDYSIRWTCHFLEYFAVFLFLVWALRLRPLTALILAVVLATADEGHQYFLPDRSFSLFDIKLDAAGAATAFVLTIAIGFLRRSLRVAPRSGMSAAAARAGTPPFKSP
jgi:VanZ family protein